MPIYEYQCKACGHEFESLQKVSDAPLIDCPGCRKPELAKLVSAAGFRLKGSGWYETDFKKKDNKKNIAGDTSEKKESKKSDDKPKAGKKETKSASSSSG